MAIYEVVAYGPYKVMVEAKTKTDARIKATQRPSKDWIPTEVKAILPDVKATLISYDNWS